MNRAAVVSYSGTKPGSSSSSGFVLIFRDPQAEHFMCLAMSGTGVSGGKDTVSRRDIALAATVAAVDPQQLVFTDEITERDRRPWLGFKTTRTRVLRRG